MHANIREWNVKGMNVGDVAVCVSRVQFVIQMGCRFNKKDKEKSE